MEADNNGNGHSNGQPRVKFGPGDTQDMPVNWASIMLWNWREKDPKKFGAALAEAAIEAK